MLVGGRDSSIVVACGSLWLSREIIPLRIGELFYLGRLQGSFPHVHEFMELAAETRPSLPEPLMMVRLLEVEDLLA